MIGGIGAALYLLCFVVSAVATLIWVYRANANAHRLNSGFDMSPAWNVGWFFVPFATYWKPYEGIREIWKISANPSDPAAAQHPHVMRLWWTFWLLSNITGSISLRIQLRGTTIGTQMFVDLFDVVSSVAFMPATWYFLIVVRDITYKQERFATVDPTRVDETELGIE